MKLSELIPKRDQRAAIVGQTGTGKTFLAKHIINQISDRKILIIDSKRTFKIDGFKIINYPNKFNPKRDDFVVYRPHEKLLNDLNAYDEIYNKAYMTGDILVYTDDLVGILHSQRYPHALQVCYQMGREKNVSMIASFQAPVFLPRFVMTECQKFFAFKLLKKADIQRVQEVLPEYDPKNLTSLHHFAFYDNTRDKLMKNMRLKEI